MSTKPRGRAVVIGAGMAGLMAAAALSDAFDEVLILEKDPLPATPAIRKGVPQGAHVHTFLGYAVQVMEELLPGIMDELYAAGAVKIRRNHDIWFHDSGGPTPIRDVGILTPSVTRPLLEHTTRLQVLALANIELRDAIRVKDFALDDQDHVVGVTTEIAGTVEQIAADLVVECSGRASRLPRWLPAQGFGEVPVQSLKIAMGYTSGLFRPPPELAGDHWACLMLAIPPGLRAAYLTPVNGGLWLATMYGRGGDMAPRDHQGFIKWSRGLAHPVIHEKLARAELVSDLWTYRIPHGNWFRYDHMPRFPIGLIPMGEALTSFNPMYGQGISLAAGQALALRNVVADTPVESLAPQYFAGCEDLNSVGWSVMETRDLAYASTTGERPADLEQRWRMGAAIRRLCEQDAEVHALSVRVTHLLESPTALTRPDIVERALSLEV
ncbi:MAG: FAD-binding protein [Chromatiales bacterium]|nr:FAD-binding protein [Chromatiales bacterium]